MSETRATVSVPIVVLTGLDDSVVAVQAVHEGAQDYLVKNDVTAARLIHALRHAISDKCHGPLSELAQGTRNSPVLAEAGA